MGARRCTRWPAAVSDDLLARAGALLAANPFAVLLGLEACRGETGGIECVLPMRAHVVGNFLINAAHGGALVALLEAAGELELCARGLAYTQVIDSSVDYLRPATGAVLHARAELVRLGRRVANVRMSAWSDVPDRPVVAGQANYRLTGAGDSASARR